MTKKPPLPDGTHPVLTRPMVHGWLPAHQQAPGRWDVYDTANKLPGEDDEAFRQRGEEAATAWAAEDMRLRVAEVEAALEAKRAAGRARQARHRAKKRANVVKAGPTPAQLALVAQARAVYIKAQEQRAKARKEWDAYVEAARVALMTAKAEAAAGAQK